MSLSVRVIARNEAGNIRDCLQSVSWADEIVVVDAFSTDDTVAICKQYTDKVYQREWDDYSSQKNYGDSLCTQDWILSLDADERVSDELRRELQALSAYGSQSHDGITAYRIPISDYMFGRFVRYGSWPYQRHVRLYHGDSGHWAGAVHEVYTTGGKIGTMRGPLLHYSHLTIGHFIAKLNRYTDLEAKRWYDQSINKTWLQAILASLRVFLHEYVVRYGFRDGAHGLVLAVLMAVYQFTAHAKLWELRRNSALPNGEAERQASQSNVHRSEPDIP